MPFEWTVNTVVFEKHEPAFDVCAVAGVYGYDFCCVCVLFEEDAVGYSADSSVAVDCDSKHEFRVLKNGEEFNTGTCALNYFCDCVFGLNLVSFPNYVRKTYER